MSKTRFLTPEEIAEDLRVSLEAVYRWLRLGILPGKKFGSLWRIRTEDYEAFVAPTQEEDS